MPYDVLQWPVTVYPGEADAECPEAKPDIMVLIRRLAAAGPSPDGYAVKTLGSKRDGLWQINLKIQKRQVRILYAPYGKKIVLFRIHRKSSSQEQERAYVVAQKRKREYEAQSQKAKPS